MKNVGKDLRIMALVAGSGAVGVLATLFVLAAIRGPAAPPGPAAEPGSPAAPAQVDAGQQTVEVESGRVSSTIRIRGSASLGQRAEPVIYIDGVRINGDRDAALKRLEPDQIDRIEVIKGDAAKELYGSEAANGVIQIVTKSKEGS